MLELFDIYINHTPKSLLLPIILSMTNVYLAGLTALEFWHPYRLSRTPYLDQLVPLERDSALWGIHLARVRSLGAAPPDSQLEELTSKLVGLTRPLRLLVGRADLRRDSSQKVCCSWNGPVPPGAFCSIGDRVFVSTPEFVFLQFAKMLPFATLVQLGCELCAGYASNHPLLPGSSRCAPLADANSIRSFLDKVGNDKQGLPTAKKAARYIFDKSGSTAETVVVMLLCLPRSRGGYGFEIPTMNQRIDIPDTLRAPGERHWVACDALWPRAPLGLEYDGRIHHTGDENVSKDYAKLNMLRSMGISVELVTRHDLFSASKFDLLARRVAKSLGIRMRNRDYDPAWQMRNRELRRELLAQFSLKEDVR